MTDRGAGGDPTRTTLPVADWFDQLEEGVVLVHGGAVVSVNRAAARLLDVDPLLARGARLISVVRDHRLEAAAAAAPSGHPAAVQPLEIDLNGRAVEAVPIAGGLLLRDRSATRQSERDAQELLAVMSHELRTPVAAIMAVLDALALDLPREQLDGFLRRASEEAARLGRLISDLTVEVRPPRERSVALDDTVTRAIAITETVRGEHGVRVAVAVPLVAVWVDPDKLLQALVNLIENAAVHGPDDELVEVVAEPVDRFVRIEVRDKGTPLDPVIARRLFETSSQVSVKARGTGLGLRIVRSMARAWGGDVWAGPRSDGVPGNAFGFSVRRVPLR